MDEGERESFSALFRTRGRGFFVRVESSTGVRGISRKLASDGHFYS